MNTDFMKEMKEDKSELETHVDDVFEKDELTTAEQVTKEVEDYQEIFKELDDVTSKSIADKTTSMTELFDKQRKAQALCSELIKNLDSTKDKTSSDYNWRDSEDNATINKLSEYIAAIGKQIADSFLEVADDYRNSGPEVKPSALKVFKDVHPNHD